MGRYSCFQTGICFFSLLIASFANEQANDGLCTQYLNTLELGSDSIPLIMKYVSTKSTLSVELSTKQKSWIGFGVSPGSVATMNGADTIIGSPDTGVAKYKMDYGPQFYNLKSVEEQTLINATILQDDSGTVLTFTKLLEDGNDKVINGNGENTFIWAMGPKNSLSFHSDLRGSFKLSLEPCSANIRVSDAKLPYEDQFKAHAIMGAIAWGILVPLAIAASGARKFLDCSVSTKKLWFCIHAGLNFLTFIFTVIIFSLAVHAYKKQEKDHFQGTHEKMGLAIFIMVTMQVLAGIFRPHVEKVEEPTSPADVNEDDKKDEKKKETKEKSSMRAMWEVAHRALGVTLFACSMYQIHSGLQLYEETFDSASYVIHYWIYISCLIFFLSLIVIAAKFRSRKE